MVSSDIKEYIKKQQSLGATDDKIKSNLLGVGWINEDIEDAFFEIQKEVRIDEINKEAEINKSVPTEANSGYIKDPYREPVGSGKPEAQTFIKKNDSDQSISRTWGAPENLKNNKEPISELRQGQKFEPKYNTIPISEGEDKGVIPNLQKPQATFVGTSFIPKKETVSTGTPIQKPVLQPDVPVIENIPQVLQSNIVGPSPIKVMPQNEDSMNTEESNLYSNYERLAQEAMPSQKSNFFGWLLFILIFMIIFVGATIFAEVTGYINLPVKFSFIESLKNGTSSDTEDELQVFTPNWEDINKTNNIEDVEKNKNILDIKDIAYMMEPFSLKDNVIRLNDIYFSISDLDITGCMPPRFPNGIDKDPSPIFTGTSIFFDIDTISPKDRLHGEENIFGEILSEESLPAGDFDSVTRATFTPNKFLFDMKSTQGEMSIFERDGKTYFFLWANGMASCDDFTLYKEIRDSMSVLSDDSEILNTNTQQGLNINQKLDLATQEKQM